MTTDERAKRRYRLLIEQIRDELGAERGWMARAAERLGVTPEYVSMVAGGNREAGFDAITKAIDAVRLEPEFFFGLPHDESPNYREHLATPPAAAAPDPPHWQEFLEKYEHVGEFDDGQLADIKGFSARQLRVRSWMDYVMVAETVRRARPSPTFEAKKAEREAQKKGRK